MPPVWRCSASAAPKKPEGLFVEAARFSRRCGDGGALSNRVTAPSRDLPTRLADGLGLESTPVRNLEPAPLGCRQLSVAPMDPPLRCFRRRIRLHKVHILETPSRSARIKKSDCSQVIYRQRVVDNVPAMLNLPSEPRSSCRITGFGSKRGPGEQSDSTPLSEAVDCVVNYDYVAWTNRYLYCIGDPDAR
jgi:hypothetical protein